MTPADNHGLSPYWGPEIQQVGESIDSLADAYGFHPDLIAAIIFHESVGETQTADGIGAAGVLGNMGFKPVVETTLSADGMQVPSSNLRWGLAILSYVVQQSGGDLFTALAAFNGGWSHVNSQQPREFATRVLDSYARAIITRVGLSPKMANQWTVAVDMRAGNVPAESIVVLGSKPIRGMRLLAEHVVYAFADSRGHAYYIRGFVVPVSLFEYLPADGADMGDQLEPLLMARLGDKSARKAPGNSSVLMACLLSMDRLRGKTTTRWYSPSSCPLTGR